MNIEGSITILCGSEGVDIELHDEKARSDFVSVHLTPRQWTQALGRLGHTNVAKMEVVNLDKVGLVHQNRIFEFPIKHIGNYSLYKNKPKVVGREADKVCPKGWVPDTFFASQDSFFFKNDEEWARTIIRRWVTEEEDEKDAKEV